MKISFFCCDCNSYHRSQINDLLKNEKFSDLAKFSDFDAHKIFGHPKPLQGNCTGYGRLLISDCMGSGVVLYLDPDLIISVDISALKDFNFHGNFLAAVPGGKVKYALERNFLITDLRLSLKLNYFSSGVLLLDLDKWKERDVKA